MTSLLERIERGYDGFPRRPGVRVEAVGPFDVFVREGPGFPFYARPRLGTVDVTVADVEAVLARQRELEIPEAIEWVLETTPALLPLIGDRLSVVLAPLMVLDRSVLPPRTPDGDGAVLLDPSSPDFAETFTVSAAVAAVGFAHGGTAVGDAGPAQRDQAIQPLDPARLAAIVEELRDGHRVDAVVVDPIDGIVARGSYQATAAVPGSPAPRVSRSSPHSGQRALTDGIAEIVGIATLPTARRRGHAATVSTLLARHAVAQGHDPVFVAAADETVARVYARIGFRRVGTAGIASRG